MLLPRSASNKNFATCLVVDFARARKRLGAAAAAREQRGPTARLARALEWQRQLDAGEVASRADIARREGLSRARVTQIMRALALTTAVLAVHPRLGRTRSR
jgi:ParB-like chromosome segregation protein Spo0J